MSESSAPKASPTAVSTPDEVVFRRFHRTQRCRILSDGVWSHQSVPWRSYTEETIPFASIELRRIRHRNQPSGIYLIFVAISLAAGFSAIVDQNDGWVGEASWALTFAAAFFTAWFAQRTRWVGLAPLFVIDSAGADQFLDRVAEAQRLQTIRRHARRSPQEAMNIVADLQDEGAISEAETQTLVSEIKRIRAIPTETTSGYL